MKEAAEVFHISKFLTEELQARGWQTEDLARQMPPGRDFGVNLLCIDLLMSVPEEHIIIDDKTFKGMSFALGVSEEFLRNLHKSWLENPEKRSPFNAPEEIFGPISHSMVIVGEKETG